eukprot:gnl/TRDRNA2_/TRDRNA2_44999_c0_seq1.p1 gnl/TRDRNA2_/TRDRNA2_44999_c0~~gnl/TRDRNA2_/TRDRNA2_44999_c0_seq1.p1  ORF type:complete len:462 (-),score=35.27 gnl/TRDRNA2_/TRDRNA2_44999_c0_seq1:21-1406(-)
MQMTAQRSGLPARHVPMPNSAMMPPTCYVTRCRSTSSPSRDSLESLQRAAVVPAAIPVSHKSGERSATPQYPMSHQPGAIPLGTVACQVSAPAGSLYHETAPTDCTSNQRSFSPIESTRWSASRILKFFNALPVDETGRVRKSDLKSILKTHSEIVVENLFGAGHDDRLIDWPEFFHTWQSLRTLEEAEDPAGFPSIEQTGDPVERRHMLLHGSTTGVPPTIGTAASSYSIQKMLPPGPSVNFPVCPGFATTKVPPPLPVHPSGHTTHVLSRPRQHSPSRSFVPQRVLSPVATRRTLSHVPPAVVAARHPSPTRRISTQPMSGYCTPMRGPPVPATDLVSEYHITIDRSSGGKLGIDVDPQPETGRLMVRTVHEDKAGLVAMWNQANPNKAVRVGDSIVEVNGVRDDVFALRIACEKNEKVTIVLERRHNATLVHSLIPTMPVTPYAIPSATQGRSRSPVR